MRMKKVTCLECGGAKILPYGCGITRAIYGRCLNCGGLGYKFVPHQSISARMLHFIAWPFRFGIALFQLFVLRRFPKSINDP